ncbi:MAG: hypothetical protein JNL38_03005 [Myxococcales bacterium]|nr:hypothetical protein [Myxococcales bacterium]
MITVVVEGDTDIPFVARLCEGVGIEIRLPVVDAAGKGAVDRDLDGYARAAQGSPYLVLRDLDQDAACAPAWLETNRPAITGKFFCLRLAVRAVEAWFLADAKTAAASLHLPLAKMPLAPDAEPDPTRTIVNLARSSPKPAIRRGLVPAAGAKRSVGPDYEGWLIRSAADWSLERALERSPSLAGAKRSLERLKGIWDGVLLGRS